MQAATHAPLTHCGVGLAQFASLVHFDWFGSGWQTPLVQRFPLPQVLESVQLATHCPSTQSLLPSLPHSLENLQALVGAVQDPPAQTSPLLQSVEAVQGHGPLVPPQASHWFAMHMLPLAQSVLVVH